MFFITKINLNQSLTRMKKMFFWAYLSIAYGSVKRREEWDQ